MQDDLKFEDGSHHTRYDAETNMLRSIAISLKRIANSMEKPTVTASTVINVKDFFNNLHGEAQHSSVENLCCAVDMEVHQNGVAVGDSPIWTAEQRRLSKTNYMDHFGNCLGWKEDDATIIAKSEDTVARAHMLTQDELEQAIADYKRNFTPHPVDVPTPQAPVGIPKGKPTVSLIRPLETPKGWEDRGM